MTARTSTSCPMAKATDLFSSNRTKKDFHDNFFGIFGSFSRGIFRFGLCAPRLRFINSPTAIIGHRRFRTRPGNRWRTTDRNFEIFTPTIPFRDFRNETHLHDGRNLGPVLPDPARWTVEFCFAYAIRRLLLNSSRTFIFSPNCLCKLRVGTHYPCSRAVDAACRHTGSRFTGRIHVRTTVFLPG